MSAKKEGATSPKPDEKFDPVTGEIVTPLRKFRIGNVTAAVWRNDGFMNVTLQKSYKEKGTEEWRNTESLSHGDILNAIKALERAEAFIAR